MSLGLLNVIPVLPEVQSAKIIGAFWLSAVIFGYTKVTEGIPPRDTTFCWPPCSGNPTAALLLSSPELELLARKTHGEREEKSVKGMSGVLQGAGEERKREKPESTMSLQE